MSGENGHTESARGGEPLRIERVPIASLHADPSNVNTHPDDNLAAIAGSLRQFGQVEPLVVQRSTGKVIGGNGRLAVMAKSGAIEVDVVRLDIDDTRAAALGIALNRTAKTSVFDDGALAKLLESLPKDLQESAGYSESDIDDLLASLKSGEVVEDEPPEPLPDPVSRRGDLWLLGNHRLLCGDATDGGDVAMVMDRGRADLCFTSPPYNTGNNRLGGNSSMMESKYIDNDDNRDESEYLSLLNGFTVTALNACEAAIVNIQQLAGNKTAVLEWMHAHAHRFVDIAIWDKESAPPQMSAGVLSNQHELLVILSAQDSPTRVVPFSNWHGGVATVYKGGGQRNKDAAFVHAATMPLHLPAWVMGTLCPLARSIYEPFSGSGTTIIAAEQLARRCFAIEIEPLYVDVAVRRWQKLTGKDATHSETGKTWKETAAERGIEVSE